MFVLCNSTLSYILSFFVKIMLSVVSLHCCIIVNMLYAVCLARAYNRENRISYCILHTAIFATVNIFN